MARILRADHVRIATVLGGTLGILIGLSTKAKTEPKYSDIRMNKPSIFDDLSELVPRARDIAVSEGRGCERCGSSTSVSRGPRGCAYHYDGKIGDNNDPNYGT